MKHEHNGVTIYQGDAQKVLCSLPDESVHCVVTSPPYWGLRDYGCVGQLGLERTPEEYVCKMVGVFAEVRRVLRDDGTLWLNMGDSYCSQPNQRVQKPDGRNDVAGYKQASNTGSLTQGSSFVPGLKPKDLIGVPWMLAFALRADGWYLRSDIIWHKPNPMPESVTDRPTKSHEYLFLLSKSERYYYNSEAIAEPCQFGDRGSSFTSQQDILTKVGLGQGPRKIKVPGGWDRGEGAHGTIHRDGRTSAEYQEAEVSDTRNKRTVWTVATQAFPEAHFATFPEELIQPCILAGCPAGGTVLDPFMGSGTTALVARNNNCKSIGIELNPEYIAIAEKRLGQEVFQF